jgi:hypothetical protein
MSVEDRRFQTKVKEGIHKRDDGHFEIPLPFKQEEVKLPNNRKMAVKRLTRLKRKMMSDARYKADYVAFMNNMIDKGYAERVPTDENTQIDNPKWYIPHHGVYHPKKPGKIRVVFDCSAEFQDESLNRHLLQGPDLTNNLTGVLCRFRKEPVAFTCDIEGMFHQVGVDENHRDYLRFLWWEDGRLNQEPYEYRMTVHLFGAASSPGCANSALKATADMYEDIYGKEAAEFVRRDFYVDDGLKSVETPLEALNLIESSNKLCAQGGFRLHKYISNSMDVVNNIPPDERAKGIQNIDLTCNVLPIEHALGVQWCVESDTFQFRVELKDRPLTRRGILSTVSSIFDPLGMVAPLLLTGKKILQELTRDGADWDDPIPEEIKTRWVKWKEELLLLADLNIPRCYKPNNFGKVKTAELHHFSDASQQGYGQCSYLRLVDEDDKVSCSLVMGKSRVTPSKPITIPRLELTAAVTSVRVSNFLKRELEYEDVKHIFWTDSKVVLGYISNEARRFHIFVANRVQQIRESTTPDQWRYIDTKDNPADLASRGASAKELIHNSLWWKGPVFLSTAETLTPVTPITDLVPDDPEIKKATVLASTLIRHEEYADILTRLEYFSSWHKVKRAIAVCLRFKQKLKNRSVKMPDRCLGLKSLKAVINTTYIPVNVEDMQNAEQEIIKIVQRQAFSKDLEVLHHISPQSCTTGRDNTKKRALKKASSLSRLDPYLDEDGVIRVGGRIQRANLPRDITHPILLPKHGHITSLIVSHYHVKSSHSGSGMTLSEIRASGYWIITSRAVVAAHVWKCVVCRKLRRPTQGQRMADLPADRLEPAPPFTYSAVDYFGPFYIKEGRRELKRYGVLFTCLNSRAIHIETANSLTTDSFLNAYRRFVCRRGSVRQLRSDQGTNFIGAKGVLAAALAEMNPDKVRQELLKDNCDWIDFKMNAPHSSHMGGVWERMIRSTRNALSALLTTHGGQLDDELLRTLLIEAEAIVNSRPLTYTDVSSTTSLEPLSPSQLLTLKSNVVLPPPGQFQKADLYCRQRWRRVQYLANEFWNRWKTEFLPTLQTRRKWTSAQPNLKTDDVVLMMDESVPRCRWPLGRIIDTFPGEDGHVRRVQLKTEQSKYERPIHKLVLLVES